MIATGLGWRVDGSHTQPHNMNMTQVTLTVPDKAPLALRVPVEALGGELLLAAAIKLYEMGRLSSGAAAELAGIPKPLFLYKLADYGVDTFDLTEEELRQEMTLA